MVEVVLNTEGDTTEIFLKGRLDVKAVNDAEDAFEEASGRSDNIILDLAGLDYIASAGLRVIKHLRGTMKGKDGTLVLRNVGDEVMEVFEMTGFAAMLTFE